MLRTFFWYAAGWSYLFATTPALLKVKFLEKRGKINEMDHFANDFSMRLARGLFYLTGSTIRVSGLDNIPRDRSVLLVSNHQSHMDSAVIHGFIDIPKGFIADRAVMSIPIVSIWMKYMKCVFITRGDKRRNVLEVERCIELLKEGRSLVIYPEGRLDEGKRLGDFSKGCVKLAIKAGVPIVPLTLVNSGGLMSRDGSRVGRAEVRCIISQPIELHITDDPGEKEAVVRIRRIIADNLTA